jgi:outer membrane biosynthesis protein TonB
MSGAGEWLAAQQAGDQRRFLNLLAGSVVAHVGFVAVMGVMPAPPRPALPEVLRVDLVGLPAAPKARATRPRPPAPPVPKQIVLPKQAPGAVPRKKAVPPPPEPVDYEDALSQLRNELGESLPEPVIPLESHATPADTLPQAAATGAVVDAETAAWQRAVSLHLRACWVTPPEYLNSRLVTKLHVILTSTGELVGAPRVTGPSGDPYFDDNTLRTVVKCAPLPRPPEPGSWRFAFTSEQR